MREAIALLAARIGSAAKWAQRSVVTALVWPSILPIMGSDKPDATAATQCSAKRRSPLPVIASKHVRYGSDVDVRFAPLADHDRAARRSRSQVQGFGSRFALDTRCEP